MRRAVGVGAIKNKSLAQSRYKNKQSKLADDESDNLCRQLEDVKLSLEKFASMYQNKIRQDEKFRAQFQKMCANIGVDPLASSCGYWSKILGLGDFYYHLGVRIIEVCMANQRKTGGLMSINDLIEELNRTKSSRENAVSFDDVVCAIKKLKCLGTGFTLIKLSDSRYLVQSVPGEMNMDQTNVLILAEAHNGNITLADCMKKLKWIEERAQAALDYLLQEGQAWIDNGGESRKISYWFPSLLEMK